MNNGDPSNTFIPRPQSSGRPSTPPKSLPSGIAASPSPRPKTKGDASTPCRNILIYGYCRYQDKGCIFKHGDGKIASGVPERRKLNVESPTFTPSATSSPAKPSQVDVPLFQPAPPQPSFAVEQNGYIGHENQGYPSIQSAFGNLGLADNTVALSTIPQTQTVNPYDYTNLGAAPVQINPYAHGATDIFYQQQSNFPQPLQYHLYAPRGPERSKLDAHQRTIHGLFLADNLREELQKKNEATLQTVPNIALPSVDCYHSLVPLDMSVQKSAQAFGFPSGVYKAWSNKDGKPYVLRRIEGFRLANEKHIMNVQRWKKILNGNIVTVHDAFTTTRFGDSSIIFVYDYHPLAKTLHDEHFSPPPATGRHPRNNQPNTQPTATEAQIWSYIVQISTALKTIHTAGLAARLIDSTKILVTGKGRIRLNACSIMDVLAPDAHSSMLEYQLEDIHSLGRLVLSLACGSPSVIQQPKKGLEHVARHFSSEFRAALNYLLVVPEPGSMKTIDEFISHYAFSHFAQVLDSAQLANDALELDLSRELENGRLVRLLTKISFITERPEYDHDRSWGETGERYFIKLFRDYVFHSVDEHGHPVVDMAHVLACMNKLDAGSDEKVMLVSRDEQNCFVVSYKEVKRGIENAFTELCKPQPPAPLPGLRR